MKSDPIGKTENCIRRIQSNSSFFVGHSLILSAILTCATEWRQNFKREVGCICHIYTKCPVRFLPLIRGWFHRVVVAVLILLESKSSMQIVYVCFRFTVQCESESQCCNWNKWSESSNTIFILNRDFVLCSGSFIGFLVFVTEQLSFVIRFDKNQKLGANIQVSNRMRIISICGARDPTEEKT